MRRTRYKRILLKISGEVLTGEGGYGIDLVVIHQIAQEIKQVKILGVDVAIVIGGGNIFRGMAASSKGMERASADYMGMLATVMNGIALQDALEKIDVDTRVLTAIEMQQIAEPYIRRRAIRHLEKGRVVIFAGGTGNPYFTTDTAASLRAMEIGVDAILKATKVDGIYDSDPLLNERARKYRKLTYLDVLKKQLKTMDATTISLCMDHQIPTIVFNLEKRGNIKRVVLGERIGTIVTGWPIDEKIVKNVEAKIEKTLAALKTDLNKVKTGRRMDYYGTPTPLHQVAMLTSGRANFQQGLTATSEDCLE